MLIYAAAIAYAAVSSLVQPLLTLTLLTLLYTTPHYATLHCTLQCAEQVRNSGVIGGLFLARGRYKKYIPAVGQEAEGTRLSEKLTMDGGLMEARVGLGGQLSRWLRPTDFVPGSVVTFEMPQSGESHLSTLVLLLYTHAL
jgi:hypothetical protein